MKTWKEVEKAFQGAGIKYQKNRWFCPGGILFDGQMLPIFDN